jgi:hypothetical protein
MYGLRGCVGWDWCIEGGRCVVWGECVVRVKWEGVVWVCWVGMWWGGCGVCV